MTLLHEKRISLNALAEREHLAIGSVWRWVTHGVRGVKLESLNVGGRRYVTEEAFIRFVERTTAAAGHRSGNAESPALRNS